MKFVPKQLEETADISKGDHSAKTARKMVLTVAVILVAGYLFLGWFGEFLAMQIPDETEVKYFSAMHMGKEDLDTPEFQKCKKIFAKLLAQGKSFRKLDYRLYYMADMEAPNAVAMPGGAVAVSKGLLKEVKDEIGLAMVLGHELGHHQSRHALRRMGRGVVISITMGLVFGADSNGLIDLSVQSAEYKNSRDQEREADLFGMNLVHQTYGSTQGALVFFEKMQAKHEGDLAVWTSFLASHPLSSERITYLKKLQDELSQKEASG